MINKNEMRKRAHDAGLVGACWDHYIVSNPNKNNDHIELEFIKDGSFESRPNVSVYMNLSRVEDKIKLTRHDHDTEVLEYKTCINNKPVARSTVAISPYMYNKKIKPYSEYVWGESKMITTEKDINVNCYIIEFSISITTEPIMENQFEVTNHSNYVSRIAVPVEDIREGIHLYIVQCADISLPIIILSKDDIDFSEVIFKGNVRPNMYNSYFHPYKKTIRKKQVYEKLAYGEPYNGCLDLQFEESYANGNYTTNDGIKAIKGDNNNVEIFLDDFKIGEYERFRYIDNISNISFVKDMNDINIFSPHYKISNKLDTQDLISIHPEVEKILYLIPNMGKIIEKVSEDDIKDTPYSEIYRANWCSDDGGSEYKYILSFTDNIYQVYVCIDDIKDLYYISNGNNIVDIGINNDEDGSQCIYNKTNNRFINYSRDTSMITFKPNYVISLDHSNNIINTNLPISGQFTGYNMFGIPKDF